MPDSPAVLLRRIARMGPHEVYTRLRQSVSRRADQWRHRLGLPPAQPARGAAAAAGAFFFDPADAPALGRAWAERSPAAAAQVIERAGAIAAHRFPLLGYCDLDFGSPIDWSLDPVHGTRAPAVAWREVPYLDFHAVGDHKIVWELSRHQHLMTLVRAWLFTGDTRWIDEAIAQWRDWQHANPYPLGINWTSTLEVAFRVQSWIWLDHWLHAAARDAFRQELARAIGHGARYISRYLSTYFAPNTHLLGEAVALFSAGVLYRQFRDAGRWSSEGWKIVLEQTRTQLRADGFHIEQSVYYHVYALDMFLHARMLAARNGLHSTDLDDAIARMASALHDISQTGCAPRFGDDDGGRVFDPSRNRADHLLDPLAAGAVLFDRPEFAAAAGAFTEEAWWLLGRSAAERFDRFDGGAPPLRSLALHASGYHVLASDRALLVVDAGPHGWGRGGHAHADALSVQIMAGRQALLSDPGTGSYPVALAIRDRLRGTSAHSTLEIDGCSQARPAGSFGWSDHPRATVELWHTGRTVDLIAVSHDGYQSQGRPLIHKRWIVGVRNRGWLVRDTALGEGTHRFDVRWRLTPDAEQLSAAPWQFQWPGGAALAIAVAAEPGWQVGMEEAEFSAAYGKTVLAPVLRVGCERAAPVETATVLVPDAAAVSVRCLCAGTASVYEWRQCGDARFIWFAETSVDREVLGWRTDAVFVMLAVDAAGAIERVAIASVTYLEAHGRTVLRAAAPIDFLEWQRGDGAPAFQQWDVEALTAPRQV